MFGNFDALAFNKDIYCQSYEPNFSQGFSVGEAMTLTFIAFCFSQEDECGGKKHLSQPVQLKQGIQLKETWAYFKN